MTVVTTLRTDELRPVLVTGGAGFIGANFVLDWCAGQDVPVVTLDKLTYAGNLHNLAGLQGNERHSFVRGDIGDVDFVRTLLSRIKPRAIVNFAAESHVDRSILGPEDFITTNIVGTFRLLETAREYWTGLPQREKEAFRFLHVSTDEVYGSLTPGADPFHEASPYSPNSPYSASKAASDHLVRAWHHTYGLPVIITNCSNNYGPYQFPEKLIPLMIHHALAGKPLPVYGDGQQIRDWLYVSDHCAAIRAVLREGQPGHTYAIGGDSEKSNIDVVRAICDAWTKSARPQTVRTVNRSRSCLTGPGTIGAMRSTPEKSARCLDGVLGNRSSPASAKLYAGISTTPPGPTAWLPGVIATGSDGTTRHDDSGFAKNPASWQGQSVGLGVAAIT